MKRYVSKYLIGILIGAMLWALCGCEKNTDTTDTFGTAFNGISTIPEMTFVKTTKDDMGVSNPNVEEVNFTYQYTSDETMLEGYKGDVQHIVYTTGTAYYTLQDDTWVKDISTTDELKEYANFARNYLNPANFQNLELEGNSNVDGIVCQRYHGTGSNDRYFGLTDYDDLEKTVYVRTDTNTVYYIELKFTENPETSSMVLNCNPCYIKYKFFGETTIVTPTAIANAISQEEYLEGTTGIVDVDNLDTETKQNLVAGYFLADGTYSNVEPAPVISWEQHNDNGEVIATYDVDADVYTNLETGEVVADYSSDFRESREEPTQVLGIPNFLSLISEETIKSKTLPYLWNAVTNGNENTISEYYTADMVLQGSIAIGDDKKALLEAYVNNKSIKDILADAQNWQSLDDDTKASMLWTVEKLNGYVEMINGQYYDLQSIVFSYANISPTDAYALMYAWSDAEAVETDN